MANCPCLDGRGQGSARSQACFRTVGWDFLRCSTKFRLAFYISLFLSTYRIRLCHIVIHSSGGEGGTFSDRPRGSHPFLFQPSANRPPCQHHWLALISLISLISKWGGRGVLFQIAQRLPPFSFQPPACFAGIDSIDIVDIKMGGGGVRLRLLRIAPRRHSRARWPGAFFRRRPLISARVS